METFGNSKGGRSDGTTRKKALAGGWPFPSTRRLGLGPGKPWTAPDPMERPGLRCAHRPCGPAHKLPTASGCAWRPLRVLHKARSEIKKSSAAASWRRFRSGSALPPAASLTKRLLERTYRKFFTQLLRVATGTMTVEVTRTPLVAAEEEFWFGVIGYS